MERSRADIRSLFDSLPGLFLVLTPDYNVVTGSDAYFASTMIKREEVVGRNMFDIFPDNPDDPAAYNTLQKLAYVVTIFVLIPAMIFTGLAMSPGMDAAWPWLLDIFGGRQSARSIHFIAASGIVIFIVVHLTLVILAGPINEVWSMITGRWKLPAHNLPAAQADATPEPEPAE